MIEDYTIEHTINRINEYLKTQLWMDFTLSSFDPGCVEMIGRIDQSGGDIKIHIRFIEPYLVICPLYFTFEGKMTLLLLPIEIVPIEKTSITIFVREIPCFKSRTQIFRVK